MLAIATSEELQNARKHCKEVAELVITRLGGELSLVTGEGVIEGVYHADVILQNGEGYAICTIRNWLNETGHMQVLTDDESLIKQVYACRVDIVKGALLGAFSKKQ
jgi:hypothetical protein